MKPNILIIMTDDQRYDAIGALGNPDIITPNLNRLVKKGCAFSNAFIPGSTVGSSASVGCPSRAMLHSGKSLFHLIKDGKRFHKSSPLMGEFFGDNGYDTFGTGKWPNGVNSYARSFKAGAEICFVEVADHWNVPVCHFDPMGHYDSLRPFCRDPYFSNKIFKAPCDHVNPGIHSTELFINEGIRYLKNRQSPNPFFLYISLMGPHDPRTMPEEFLELYDPKDIKLPDNLASKHPFDIGSFKIRDEMLTPTPREEKEIRKHLADYYAMMSHIDYEIGLLLQNLEQLGEMDNTLIVLASDSGLALGQHGLMGKHNCYEHSIRIPLVFCGPGIPKGKVRDDLVYLHDLFPTLCDYSSLQRPNGLDGMNLYPVIRGDQSPQRDHLYFAYGTSIRAIRNEHYKLLEYSCGKTQLFDLSNDPLEQYNLADKEDFFEILEVLRKQLVIESKVWDDHEHLNGQVFWHKRRDLKQNKPAKKLNGAYAAL